MIEFILVYAAFFAVTTGFFLACSPQDDKFALRALACFVLGASWPISLSWLLFSLFMGGAR